MAAAGLGSRREVERWIKAGRLSVNGIPASIGDRITAMDHVALDGRRLRLRATAATTVAHVLIHHRAPGVPLDLREVVGYAERKAKELSASRRWLAIQALPPVDGGLEILTDDGPFAQKISRMLAVFTMDYALRVRGRMSQVLVDEFQAATEVEDEPMQILAAEAEIGPASNHWIKTTVRATRSAQVRHWWGAQGFSVGRLMRVRFGPIHLEKTLPRGHSRLLSAGEVAGLQNETLAVADHGEAGELAAPSGLPADAD